MIFLPDGVCPSHVSDAIIVLVKVLSLLHCLLTPWHLAWSNNLAFFLQSTHDPSRVDVSLKLACHLLIRLRPPYRRLSPQRMLLSHSNTRMWKGESVSSSRCSRLDTSQVSIRKYFPFQLQSKWGDHVIPLFLLHSSSLYWPAAQRPCREQIALNYKGETESPQIFLHWIRLIWDGMDEREGRDLLRVEKMTE